MIRFKNGPAAAKTLRLHRAPLFLRVVIAQDGTVDALDNLDNEPRDDEAIHVYRRDGEPGTVHIDGTRNGRRFSEWLITAEYRLHREQPTDETARNNVKWTAWAQEQYSKEKRQVEG